MKKLILALIIIANGFFGNLSAQVTCLEPTYLSTSNVTSTSVDLSWVENNSATSWQIEYDTANYTQGTGNISIVNNDTIYITGLSASTDYEFFVRSICGIGDTSLWVGPFGFCTSYGAPFFNDMESEDLDAPPACWGSVVNVNYAWVEVEDYNGSAAAYSGSQALYIYGYNGSPTDTVMAVTPKLSDLVGSDKQIRFIANSDNPDSKLIIGTMASPDATVLNPIDTIFFQLHDTYKKYIVRFNSVNGYNGTDQYIYLAHSLGGIYDYIRIDDFYYENIPSCLKPLNRSLSLSKLTPNSVDVDWTEVGNATEWEIQYDTTGFSLGTGVTSIVNTQPATVSGLSPNFTYDIYVRSICGNGDSSLWTGPITVETSCLPTTVPYYNDFENEVDGGIPNCWSVANTYETSYAYVNSYTGTSVPFSGNKAFYMFSSTSKASVDVLMAVSPAFSDLPAYDKQISFFTNSDHPISELIIGTMGNPLDTSLSPLDTITFFQEDTYEEVIFKFDTASGYNGTDQYIYLQHSLGGDNDQIRIDNFHYETIRTCSKPFYASLEIDNLTAHSVDFSWVNSGASSTWEIEYGAPGFTNGTGTKISVTSNPATVNGLTPSTAYQLYVRSICGRGDTSYWSGPYEFKTPCASTTAPYYNDFESNITGEKPLCWNAYAKAFNASTGLGSSWVEVRSNAGPYAGSKALFIYSSNASPGMGMLVAITPGFSDLTAYNKQIRFFANSSDPVTQLIIGTMSSPIDTGNMHPLDTITFAQADIYQEIIFLFDAASGYNGMDQYIYLQHNVGGAFDYIRIDNFHYEEIPTCRKPDSLLVTNITSTSADLNWLEMNAATEWQIQYGSSGFALGTGIDSIATTNPFTVTGLSSATYYEFYVRSVCGSGDSSSWTGPYEFVTDCPNSYAAPHFNGFEKERLDSLPLCWSSIATVSSSSVDVQAHIGNSAPYSGSKALYMASPNSTATTDTVMAISPRFSGLKANNKHISFFANSTDPGSKLIVGTMSSPTSAILNPIDTITFATPNTYQEVIVKFDTASGYNGTDEFIYLKHSLGAISSIRISNSNNTGENIHQPQLGGGGGGPTLHYIRIDEFKYYEFVPIDASITDLTAPENDTSKCFGAAEILNVELSSLGSDTLDFTVDTTVVTVNVTGAITQTLSFTVDDNSLNGGVPLVEKDSIILPIGTLDMTNPGIYYFDISLSMVNDGKVSNNTFSDTVFANLEGNIIGPDSICFGDNVNLVLDDYVGSIQWQSGTGGTFIDIPGADSANIFVNPTTVMSYRAFVCGNAYSDTLTIEPIPVSQPIAFDSTLLVSCGDTGTVALVATSINPNAVFEWFDVPTGGTALTTGGNITSISQNGDTLYYRSTSIDTNSPAIDTFYVQEVVQINSGICVSIRDTAIATIDCLVGMNEPENSFANISIQPNPSKGIFHIIVRNVKKEMEISIYNTNGKLVYHSTDKFSNNFKERIDISGFAKGLYFVKLQEKQSFEMRKIVIN